MGRQARTLLVGFFLLAFLGALPQGGLAQSQDIDAKMKQLEDLEARVDAKLKKLDSNPMLGGQVSFRGGYTHLTDPQHSKVFTGSGPGQDGWMVGAALDVPLMKDPFLNNMLLGQISMDYSGISGNTKFALGTSGRQSLYKIAVSPKYRIDTLGAIRPWVIPIGLSFLVNSPPSQAATYLTVGGTTGLGVEYVLLERFALGVAFSYNFYSSAQNDASNDHLTVGPYVGINY